MLFSVNGPLYVYARAWVRRYRPLLSWPICWRTVTQGLTSLSRHRRHLVGQRDWLVQQAVSLYVTNVACVCVQSSRSIMTFKVNLSSHVNN